MKKSITAALMALFCVTLLCTTVFAQNADSDFTMDGNGTITKYAGWDNAVVIPARIRGTVVKTIGPNAFASMDLISVTIPDGVTTIGTGAFARNQLTSVTIPASVISIDDEAFRNNRLTAATIQGSGVHIGASAFRDNQLANVTISGSVAVIESEAFSNNRLTSITIPGSGVQIAASAFSGNQLTSVTLPGSAASIGYGAFSGNRLTSITIPGDGVIIGYGAFSGNQLTSVSIPGNNANIGSSAFSGNQLTSITIPGDGIIIAEGAFSNNRLTSVTVSGNNVSIGSSAFAGNSSLTSITLGSNHIFSADIVPAINRNNANSLYIDYRCNGRQAGTYAANRGLGNAIREGDYSYYATPYGAYISEYHGSGGNRLIIPGELGGRSVKALSGFSNKNIERVQIPGSVVYIESGAFSNNQINTAVIPNSVIYIGSSAFANNQLTSVTVPGSVVYIESGAFSNNQINTAVIPNSVIYIGSSAFANNRLTSVTVPGSVTYIGSGAFANNQLTSLTVPERCIPSYEMVRVPGGSFQMGTASGGNDNERPVRTVTLSAFSIGKYEVTQALYEQVTGNNPSDFKGGNLPVENVSWYNAVEFCNNLSLWQGLQPVYTINKTAGSDPNNKNSMDSYRWLVTADWSKNGYRLPAEAQWEYAARGGNGTPGNFTYSGSNNADEVAWYRENSGRVTRLVGTKKPNGLGIYDMSGNVWEWCWDWHGSYSSTAQTDPVGASSGSYRVSRGGIWSSSAEYVRSADRGGISPNYRYYSFGFRRVRP